MKPHETIVPLSVLDPDDEGGELAVRFEWRPGTPETGRFSGPPENYDPGEPDEFTILSAAYVIRGHHVPCGTAMHEDDKLAEWLDENWERPEPEEPPEREPWWEVEP